MGGSSSVTSSPWHANRDAGRPCERGIDRAPFPRPDGGMLICVSAPNDIAEFLTSRRAPFTPEQVGLPTFGPRRVQGLRREEVASLAGVSVEYYKRLERGKASGVSEAVLEALASALQLDDAERAHLLTSPEPPAPSHPNAGVSAQQRVRPVVLRILESIGSPAIVRNSRVDYLAANPLGRALYAPLFDSVEQPANSARFTFLDPAAQDFCVDWERVAKDLVAPPALRSRPKPLRRGPLGSRRRAVNPQRRLSHLVGSAQRSLPPDRQQAPAPPRRRRARTQLRGDGPRRR